MKKNKGFTLIELLAIIVILAIIAVITVPIILNVIDNAKRGTAKDSAYGYKDAISKYYVSGMLEDESIKLSGDYNVVDGKLGEYDIPFSGTKPTSGYLTFENNALTSGCLTIDEYKVTFANGEVTNVEVGECGQKVAYKCKRATELHTEECTQTDSTRYCSGAGYTVTGTKGTTTITYGNLGTRGVLSSGDAFDCDVNGDDIYDSQTERFYYIGDLFNTNTKQYNSDYGILIYYSNTIDGSPDKTSLSAIAYYSLAKENWHGPITAIDNLPSSELWSNVSLQSSSRSILNENNSNSNNGAIELPTAFSYEGYAARFLTKQEIFKSCNVTFSTLRYEQTPVGEFDSCNYLMENTNYSDSSLGTLGYWLETSQSSSSTILWYINSSARYMGESSSSNSTIAGVRPVIEVLKTDIEI